MPATPPQWPSKSRVSKAGRRLRKILNDPVGHLQPRTEVGEAGVNVDALELWIADYEVAMSHRDSHAKAMASAGNSLRYHCKALGIEGAKVTQRLKRLPTILEKLKYEPTCALDNMHDLGGVRAVVPTVADVRALESRIAKGHPDSRVRDYIDTPRRSGYRAVHIIAEWGRSPRRPIEIQLRSTVMHDWADMVETAARAYGVSFKHDGDTTFHRWAAAESRIMAAFEMGVEVSKELEDEYAEAYAEFFDVNQGGDE